MDNSSQLILSITAAAAILAEGRSVDEITLLATSFSQLADTLTTIAAAKVLSDAKEGKSDDNGTDLGLLNLT